MHSLAFHGCATCGVTTRYLSLVDDRIGVNLRLAEDPAALETIGLRHFDGAATWRYPDQA